MPRKFDTSSCLACSTSLSLPSAVSAYVLRHAHGEGSAPLSSYMIGAEATQTPTCCNVVSAHLQFNAKKVCLVAGASQK